MIDALIATAKNLYVDGRLDVDELEAAVGHVLQGGWIDEAGKPGEQPLARCARPWVVGGWCIYSGGPSPSDPFRLCVQCQITDQKEHA